ncbi:MAG: hypothetical protein MJK12_15480 [Colwellia sp.]|nr:hypothetical protein [Colwellia sp.]
MLIQEFEQLKPNSFGIKDTISIVLMFGILLFSVERFSPDSSLQPVFSMFIIVLVGLQANIIRENRRTNKRIDLLSQIVSNNSTVK